jgi:quercetin dioxygenase-like cupin family protein
MSMAKTITAWNTPAASGEMDFETERAAAVSNGCVGTKLLSQTDRVRVWTITLEPGERIGLHTHVLDYFWTAVTPGRGRSRNGLGEETEVVYQAGDIKHLKYGAGESMMHDLCNIGDTRLIFVTVEFLDSDNPPLALPAEVLASLAQR